MVIIAQNRFNNTTANSLFSPARSEQYFLDELIVSNVSGASLTFRIFVDIDGTTYDQTTSLYYDITLKKGQTYEINLGFSLKSSAGNIAVQNSVANGVNWTLKGESEK